MTEPPDEAKKEKLREIFSPDDHSVWYHQEDASDDNKGNDKSDDESSSGGSGEGNGSGEENDGDRDSSHSSSTLEEEWREIAESLQTDLETFAKQQVDKAGGLMQNLKEVNREKYDYTDFLKKFAVLGEVMKINDDEFDYIFYTYGLKLYDKMPLIEPLEYKEEKRIKEFVVAIDTSGSVQGELVQTFLQKTYKKVIKGQKTF